MPRILSHHISNTQIQHLATVVVTLCCLRHRDVEVPHFDQTRGLMKYSTLIPLKHAPVWALKHASVWAGNHQARIPQEIEHDGELKEGQSRSSWSILAVA